MVLRRCRQLLADESAAVDAMQDVFVQLLRNREKLEDRGMSSLLYRIATNICLNRIRSRRRRPEDSNSDLLHKIAEISEFENQSMARSLIHRALGGEPESTGTIAVMHLVDRMTLEEVAAAVSLSVSGVRKRLRKFRHLLQQLEPNL